MRIVFMGTPSYATDIFASLLKNKFEVVAIFTQPDKPSGRSMELTPPHIKNFCIMNNINIPIYQPIKLRDSYNYEIIKGLNPDIIIVAAYGQILPKEILDIAPCVNLHASILPKYRGASPIQESLLGCDNYTGVTAMLMDEGLDSGEILAIKYLEIKKEDDVGTLFVKLSQVAAQLTIEVLENFLNLIGIKQNQGLVSYCKKIKKEYGCIEFLDANEIFAKFRAYLSWPGVFLSNGIKLKQLELVDNTATYNAGEILEIGSNYIIVGCLIGSLKIISLQPSSKKEMNSVEYIRGKRLVVGNILL